VGRGVRFRWFRQCPKVISIFLWMASFTCCIFYCLKSITFITIVDHYYSHWKYPRCYMHLWCRFFIKLFPSLIRFAQILCAHIFQSVEEMKRLHSQFPDNCPAGSISVWINGSLFRFWEVTLCTCALWTRKTGRLYGKSSSQSRPSCQISQHKFKNWWGKNTNTKSQRLIEKHWAREKP